MIRGCMCSVRKRQAEAAGKVVERIRKQIEEDSDLRDRIHGDIIRFVEESIG